jgi:hypothetical protein
MVDEAELQQLINQFALCSREHHTATVSGNWKEVNRNARCLSEMHKALVALGDPGRQALLTLVSDTDASVRLMAATFSLGYAPDLCVQVLQNLATYPGLLGFDAKQTIKRWKGGSWQLA